MSRGNSVMRHGLLAPPSARPSFICTSCLQKQRRISTGWLQKKADGEKQWKERAESIFSKKRQGTLEMLEDRGFIHDIAGGRSDLNRLMNGKRVGVYVGVDPTAASLHVGHMLPFMVLFWMYLHGFHAVSVLGTSTASIGDPTGRTTSRGEMTNTERKANAASMHYQIKRLWVNIEKMGAKHGYPSDQYSTRALFTNAYWWNSLTFLEIMKLLGSGLRVGAMLAKDTVKTKMESGDGMSLAEFMYPVMQSWDWWHLYTTKGVQIQIGGQDQYGNITAGIDAIKHLAKSHPDPVIRQEGGVKQWTTPYGITVPLLTTASGEKFGKSAGNAVWLDKEMTSVFDLYGFFVRTADADVERYLKLFTFLPMKKINSIMEEQNKEPSKRVAQHALAYEFVEMIHGAEEAQNAERTHRALFQKPSVSALLSGNSTSPAAKAAITPETAPNNPLQHNQNPAIRQVGEYVSNKLNPFAPQTNHGNAPDKHIILPKSLVYNTPIARVLYSAGLVTSRSEGHRVAQLQGAYIGSRASDAEQMADDLSFVTAKLQDPMQTWKYVIRDYRSPTDRQGEGVMSDPSSGEEGILILRIGKWKVKICRIVSDAKFEEMKINPPPPGWVEFKSASIAARQKADFEDFEREEAEARVIRKDAKAAVHRGEDQAHKYFIKEYNRKKQNGDKDGTETEADTSDTPKWLQNMQEDLEEENQRIKEIEASKMHNRWGTSTRSTGFSSR